MPLEVLSFLHIDVTQQILNYWPWFFREFLFLCSRSDDSVGISQFSVAVITLSPGVEAVHEKKEATSWSVTQVLAP